MSDDWQPGDLALCVSELKDGVPAKWNPNVGGIYTVAEYRPQRFGSGFLELEEDPYKFDPSGAAWEPLCFRKIRPHLPDAEDAETIALLTGGKVTA